MRRYPFRRASRLRPRISWLSHPPGSRDVRERRQKATPIPGRRGEGERLGERVEPPCEGEIVVFLSARICEGTPSAKTLSNYQIRSGLFQLPDPPYIVTRGAMGGVARRVQKSEVGQRRSR